MLARKIYEMMRRKAAALKVQKNLRKYFARKSYLQLQGSALTLQAGLRAMSGRKEFRFRKETKAAILIQVSSFLSFLEPIFDILL
jgi:myosin V